MFDMNAYQRRRYEERKAKALALLGGRCAECGARDSLEFDHIDPATKSFVVTTKFACLSWDSLKKELAKCQLLCTEHHKEKTLRDSGTVSGRDSHGTLTSYRYCKCDICRAAKSAHSKQYKAHRKAA